MSVDALGTDHDDSAMSCSFSPRRSGTTSRHVRSATSLWLLLSCAPAALAQAGAAEEAPAFLAVVEEARRVCASAGPALWPGFDLASIPIALYDEERAWLVHHPEPPEGFERVAGGPLTTAVFRGPRSVDMNANTAGLLGGAVTAFVRADGLGAHGVTSQDVALVVHEAAHAFQGGAPDGDRTRWPGEDAWLAPDYPDDDATNHAWARVEGRLLVSALTAPDDRAARAAVADFLAVRTQRQQALGGPWPDYERRLELNEGLAEYFALRALASGTASKAGAPAGKLPASALGFDGSHLRAFRHDLGAICVAGRGAARRRFYLTGAAQALLLDRLGPGWKEQVQGADAPGLQDLLAAACGVADAALPARLARVRSETSFAELLAFEQRAVAAVRARRRARLNEVLAAPERLLVLDLSLAGGAGNMTRFDPMNVTRVEPGLRLHTRMLELAFEGGSASFERPVVQDLGSGVVMAELPRGAVVRLDPTARRGQVQAAGLFLKVSWATWATDGDLLLIRPGPPDAGMPDTSPHRARVRAARAAAAEPLPAPPLDALDLRGQRHLHPGEDGRPLVLVFVSAAGWAVPAHRFAEALFEADLPRPDEGSARVLLVASQCSTEELAGLMRARSDGAGIIHDADRSLATLFGVETYPTSVWVDATGTIERVTSGNHPEHRDEVLHAAR